MRELENNITSSYRENLYIFLKRLVSFLFPILLVTVVLFSISRYLSSRSLNIEDEILVLICWDSHTKSAINDSVLSSSINISLTSQPFFYTYSILVPLLAENPQIQTVLLGYSFHSLVPIIDVLLFDSERAQKACLDREAYLSVVSLSYVLQLVRADGIQILGLSSIKQILKSIRRSSIHNLSFIGSYYPSTGQNLTEENVEAAIERHYLNESSDVNYGIALYQVDYLYKIDELCKNSDIELFLVNTPISSQYYEAIPKSLIENYYYIASTVDATLLDFHDFSLSDSCYGDSDHLNFYGATEFSLFLDSMLVQY